MAGFLTEKLWRQLADFHKGEPKLYTRGHMTFSVYQLKINLLTYAKGQLHKKIRVVGIPLSVCEQGFCYKDDEGKRQLIDWLISQKGFTVVLNAKDTLESSKLIKVQTLPTVILRNDFNTYEDYNERLRAHYRYRIVKAKRKFEGVKVIRNASFNEEMYKLYEAVYEKSNYKLEKSDSLYFKTFNAQIDAFYMDEQLIGFCQYTVIEDVLYFLFCGIDYEVLERYDTYYNMLLHMIKQGIALKVDEINFGQTTEDVKQKLGGKLESRDMYIYHSNVMMRGLIKAIKSFIGYKVPQKNYHVFRKGI